MNRWSRSSWLVLALALAAETALAQGGRGTRVTEVVNFAQAFDIGRQHIFADPVRKKTIWDSKPAFAPP
jgi:hypothetical protein